MTEESWGGDTNVSLTHLRASSYPIMRRLDQQFELESKFADYGKEISRVSSLNKVALTSLGYQERRLKELQAMLRSSSSVQTGRVSHQISRESQVSNGYDVDNHQVRSRRREDSEEGRSNQTMASIRNHANADSDGATVEDMTNHQTLVREEATNKLNQITTVPNAPTTFIASEIRHDSFVVAWDIKRRASIVDYEIKYGVFTDGREKEVRLRLSKWVLREPVPINGRFCIESLEPNTEYRDIAIRSRNCVGWSEFSEPITCIVTGQIDEEYASRRGKFLYRIGYIEQSINNLEAKKKQIPAQQVLLARRMSQTQDERILELNDEIERVVAHEDSALLSSHVLHGATQMFTKTTLQRKLKQELVICRENIAQWRAEIIDLDRDSSELEAEIEKKETQLKDRKAALLQFDRQHAMVANMKHIVSKHPNDLKRFYISIWKSRVADRLKIRNILDIVARSCKLRICARAWRQLYLNVSSRQKEESNEINAADGIGGVLISSAKKCVQENLYEASYLIAVVKDIHVNEEEDLTTIKTCPMNLLCKDDQESLTTGNFLFSSGYFKSSLKHFQLVLSKMESRVYFSGMSSKDAGALYAEVNGKVGHVHIKLGSFGLALVYFGRQLSLAEEEDLDEQRMCALMGLGMCYHGKFDHLYAEKFFNRALNICLTKGDKEREAIAYAHLQKCCECLNRPEEAELFAAKIEGMDTQSWYRSACIGGDNTVSQRSVEQALQDLNTLRRRLVDTTANTSHVVKLEVASAHRVQLQGAQSDKEQRVRKASDQLSASKELSDELKDLLEQIEFELEEAKHTKKNRLVSALVGGAKQDIKKSELLLLLRREHEIVEKKLEGCLNEIAQTEMLIHNTKDDIEALKDEIGVEESQLMRRILRQRKYRCISLNSSNIACDDVTGVSGNGVSSVALSEGENCYIHSLKTGKLENIFIGDGEGSTSTITSLFFRGNCIYSGTMNSIILCWDISTSKKLFVAKGHKSAVTCICADDSKIISGSADKSIIVWNTDGTLIRRVGGHSRGVQSIQCGTDWCVSASYGTVFVWDILTANESEKIKGFDCACRLVLPNGNVTALHYGELEVITGDSLGALSVWWIESGELLQSFKVHDGPVSSLQVDATKAISCGLDMTINVSDIIRGEVLHTLRGHASPVLDVAFDRKQIISLSSDGEMRYWDWKSSSSRKGKKTDIAAPPLGFSSIKQSGVIEEVIIEEDNSESLTSAPKESKGSLMGRIASRFPRRRTSA